MNRIKEHNFNKLSFIKRSKLSVVTIVISLLFTGLFLTVIPPVSAEIFCGRCSNTNGCEWAKFYTDSSVCNASAGPNSNPYGVQRESRPPTQCAPIGGGDNTRCNAYTNNPKGSLDEVNLQYGYVRGWACDNDDNNNQIWVHIYADGAMQGAVQATLERSDVASQCGGTTAHGFVMSLPTAIRDGNVRQIHAYGINDYVGGNPELWNSPQPYQAKDCARCSSTYGCTWSVFVARDTTCTNPISIPGYTPTYSPNTTSCSLISPIPSGGNNDNCPIPTATRTPTPTPTPTPKTCTRCSANFGCKMATFQSNDNCVNPLPGTTPEYTPNTDTCGIINPLPPGGNNDSCAVSCGRCSTLYGCRYANFKTLDACRNTAEAQTAQPYGTVDYTTDQVRCPALKPAPADGNNNYCQTNTCSRCSNTRGCSLATFQTYDNCSTPAEADSAQPVGSVRYDKSSTCPRLIPVPDGGDNLNCPAITAPDINFTIDDNLTTIKTISSTGGDVLLKWSVSPTTGVTCLATGDWSGSKTVPSGTQTISLPANSGSDQVEYVYTLTCTNSSPASAIVKVLVEPESSNPSIPGDRNAVFEQTSGIIFNGGRSIGGLTNPDLGKLSERSWLVGGALDGASEEIASYKSPSLTTSYSYLLSAQDQTSKNFSEINCTNGTCEPLLESGVYHITDEDPNTYQTYTFDQDQTIAADAGHPNGKKIVVLVDGDFLLKNKIVVDTKSIFILAVKRDILVDPSLGQGVTYACNVAPALASLQGIYSAQGNFNVRGIGPTVCSPNKDQMLIIDGSVITNADLSGGGSFINGRDLCENNLLYPAVSIRQRADFIVNLPEFVKRQKLIFKEVTP